MGIVSFVGCVVVVVVVVGVVEDEDATTEVVLLLVAGFSAKLVAGDSKSADGSEFFKDSVTVSREVVVAIFVVLGGKVTSTSCSN